MRESVRSPILKKHERVLLEEVYKKNFEGERFSYKDIWFKIQGHLPDYFRPEYMDRRLISQDGEKIRVLGVVTLQKNRQVIKKIDRMMAVIWQIIQKNPDLEKITISSIAELSELSEKEASFLFHLMSEFGLYTGASNQIMNTLRYESISTKDNMEVIYKYKEYPGMAKLLLLQDTQRENTQEEYFNPIEIIRMSQRLDMLKDFIRRELDENLMIFQTDQRLALEALREELDELKPLLSKISKKQWYETFLGKMVSKGIEKIILDPLAIKIIEFVKPIAKGLLHNLRNLHIP